MESLGSPAAPPRPATEGSGSSPTALVPPPYRGPLPTPPASAVTSAPNGATPVLAFGFDVALVPPTAAAPLTAPTDVGPSDPVVQLSGVGHRFGTNDALRDLSFEVPDGAITVLLGPNGAGKTTAIRAITGALAPMWGTVRTFGLDPDDDGHLVRPRCGVVSAKPALYDRLSGRDNLAYAAELYGVGDDAADRIERCATRFGIEDALDQLVGGLLRDQEPVHGVHAMGRECVSQLLLAELLAVEDPADQATRLRRHLDRLAQTLAYEAHATALLHKAQSEDLEAIAAIAPAQHVEQVIAVMWKAEVCLEMPHRVEGRLVGKQNPGAIPKFGQAVLQQVGVTRQVGASNMLLDHQLEEMSDDIEPDRIGRAECNVHTRLIICQRIVVFLPGVVE